MKYEKEMNDDEIVIFEKMNIDMFIINLNSFINLSFNIFSSLTFFFFYMNHIHL